jgi:hypothetical protein
MQRFQQGSQSVEDYYQELQKGMIRCGLFEENDAAMARFCGGLNREIHDILDYKEYDDMTTLFSYACKAEREVQGRRSKPFLTLLRGEAPLPAPGMFLLHHLSPRLHLVIRQPKPQALLRPQAPLLP